MNFSLLFFNALQVKDIAPIKTPHPPNGGPANLDQKNKEKPLSGRGRDEPPKRRLHPIPSPPGRARIGVLYRQHNPPPHLPQRGKHIKSPPLGEG